MVFPVVVLRGMGKEVQVLLLPLLLLVWSVARAGLEVVLILRELGR